MEVTLYLKLGKECYLLQEFHGIKTFPYFEESFLNHLNCGGMKVTGKYCWKKKI